MPRQRESAEQLIRRLVAIPHKQDKGLSTWAEGWWGWFARRELEGWVNAENN